MLALLRRHYGEDVDIAQAPAEILALASASLDDIEPGDARILLRRLRERGRFRLRLARGDAVL